MYLLIRNSTLCFHSICQQELATHKCLHILQHYTFWKKEIPSDDDELRKFQTILVNLYVSNRLYKEAYEKQDVTG